MLLNYKIHPKEIVISSTGAVNSREEISHVQDLEQRP